MKVNNNKINKVKIIQKNIKLLMKKIANLKNLRKL